MHIEKRWEKKLLIKGYLRYKTITPENAYIIIGTCKCIYYRLFFSNFAGVHLGTYNLLHGFWSLFKISQPTTKAIGSEIWLSSAILQREELVH